MESGFPKTRDTSAHLGKILQKREVDDAEGQWVFFFFFKYKGLEKEEKIKILNSNCGAGLEWQEHLA